MWNKITMQIDSDTGSWEMYTNMNCIVRRSNRNRNPNINIIIMIVKTINYINSAYVTILSQHTVHVYNLLQTI